MAATTGSGRKGVGGRTYAAACCSLALLLTGAAAGSSAADATPTPLPSAGGTTAPVRLPVIPTGLDPQALKGCTKASPTVARTVPWAQQSLELLRAGQLSSGAGVTVAVVDTGVSRTAPALAGRVTAAGDAGKDCVGHGTFVAGLIAAAPAAGSGFSGVAPGSRVLGLSGFGPGGAPSEPAVAQAVRTAVDAGASVVDVSLGFQNSSAALDSALAYAARKDVLVVAAAVSDGVHYEDASDDDPPAVPFWPAARPGVLSVVDVDDTGSRPDGAVRPARADLAAPGDGVISIGPRGRGHYLGDGPSVAAALVAGAAVLLRSYAPKLTAPEVAARLEATAYPAPVPVLDAYAALSDVLPGAAGRTATPDTAFSLHPEPADPGPGHRALLVVAGSALAAGALAANAALARRRRSAPARSGATTPAAPPS
ncbi:S8 family serine peptidase [Actinacidiphila acidipaludis]|uniref:S8 family serine peptidase n=1 Tax=Actinacidiphila acidipaludis TaxID=2873382 RepID=A0ABS7Q5X2_9ACTN|nr:S8 family serine peptidase [Streptomyces acidipaludis]MBY8877397.1 S8 family serine peptidase [Streptomyces acidipaludis]